MDKRQIAIGLGQAGLAIGLFLAFIVVLSMLLLFAGPQAPPTPQMNCSLINNITSCHV